MEIQSEALVKTLEKLKERGYSYLKKITAIDYVDHIDAVYILDNMETHEQEVVKIRLPADKPKVETVMSIFKAADWYERELFEMFGIQVTGREIKRLLLEEWNGSEAPLRKSFAWAKKDYKKLS